MKRAMVLSFLGAAGCHALVLFGFQVNAPAVRLSLGDGADMEVSLAAGDGVPENAVPGDPVPTSPVADSFPAPAETAPLPEPEAAVEPMASEVAPSEPVVKASPTPVEPAIAAKTASASSIPATSSPAQAPKPNSKPAVSAKKQAMAARQSGNHGKGELPGTGGTPGGATFGGQPRYRSHPRPEYPAQARRERQEGVTVLTVRVEPDGKPSEVSLYRSSGFPLLDEAATRGVKRWTFEPAIVAGIAIATEVKIPVRFDLLP